MKTIFTLIFCLSFSIAMAQSNSDPSFDDETHDLFEETNYDWKWEQQQIPLAPPPPPVPIDGGVSFLFVAGLGYGLKKMRRRKR